MFYSDALLQAIEDYVNGGSWEAFHAVLESDFYHNSCNGKCIPCSREHAAKQLVKIRRQLQRNEDAKKQFEEYLNLRR
jgi:NADH:ubiquinone oxidoreductase subunit F (NADH-binding)